MQLNAKTVDECPSNALLYAQLDVSIKQCSFDKEIVINFTQQVTTKTKTSKNYSKRNGTTEESKMNTICHQCTSVSLIESFQCLKQ